MDGAVATSRRSIISAWSAVSALGSEPDAFPQCPSVYSSQGRVPGPEWGLLPVDCAYLVPDFDPAAVLGRKGTRSMDRLTCLAVAAVKHLLAEQPEGVEDDAALVLGTTGSTASVLSFSRDSFANAKPFFVDPARFPNTVLNSAAGQCAIRHGLHGPNTTVAAGRASGLMALNYALRLQRADRASTVLCGAVEEFSAERSWLEWHSRGHDSPTPLGEGCAVVLLEHFGTPERHGRTPLAEVLTAEFTFFPDEQRAATALAVCIQRALTKTQVRAVDVCAVSVGSADGAMGDRVMEATDRVWSSRLPQLLPTAPSLGDLGAAEGLFQLVMTLVITKAQDRRGVAALTCLDREGVAGCVLLRLL